MASKKRNIPLKKGVNPVVDSALWVGSGVLLASAIGLDWYYQSMALALRMSGWILMLCLLFSLILATQHGQGWREFARLAWVELRKVTWASRRETTQTTWVVAAFVVLASLILWGMDALLSMLVNVLSDLI